MKVYLNSKNETFKVPLTDYEGCDFIFFGFNSGNKINYKRELNGSESVLHELSLLSKKIKKPMLIGATTDNYGIVKNSAIVLENGKLLGISDNVYAVNDVKRVGAEVRKVFKTANLKFGVLICEDIIDIDGVKAMAICDADAIFIITKGQEKKEYNHLIRSYAYLFGVPALLITESSILASDINGEIIGGTNNGVLKIDLPIKKVFKLISYKRKGVFT